MHMKSKMQSIGILTACVLAMCCPTFAHHAWSGYDMAKLTTVTGTVTQFDWGNPHVWIYLQVKDDKGNMQKWNVGGPSPSRMAGTGWSKSTLKPGDQITAIGHRIADGTNFLRTEKVVLQDGHELLCYGDR
jgi:hypothetical protein